MRSIVCAAAVVALAACRTAGKEEQSAKLDSFCKDMFTAVFDFEARCTPQLVPSTREDALRAVAEKCNSSAMAYAKASLAAGRLELDTSVADRCVADVSAMTCASSAKSYNALCENLFIPKVAGSGICYSDAECVSRTCAPTHGCQGVCAVYGSAGDPCGKPGDRECDPLTAWCDSAAQTCRARMTSGACAASYQCASGFFCKAPSAVGACKPSGNLDCSCAPRGETGAACTFSTECLDGLACAGTCQAPAASGQPCLDSVGCEPPLTCLSSGLADGAATCGEPRSEGGECLSIADCASNLTCRGADLNARPQVKGTCGPFGGEGEPCHPLPEYFVAGGDCGPGLSCQNGTCQKRPGAGAACSPENRCFGDQLACVPSSPGGSTGKCGPMPSPGENCASFACAKGAYCELSTDRCAAMKQQGESCSLGAECLSGACGSDQKCADACTPE